MRAMSKVSVFVGILLIMVGLVGSAWGGWISYRQWLALDALRSADVQPATLQLLIAGAGLLLGGFFLGLGLGRPRKQVAAPADAPSDDAL
ncbi:MAG: hypothetical protein WAL91_10145 [Propionicimonas sp.]